MWCLSLKAVFFWRGGGVQSVQAAQGCSVWATTKLGPPLQHTLTCSGVVEGAGADALTRYYMLQILVSCTTLLWGKVVLRRPESGRA